MLRPALFLTLASMVGCGESAVDPAAESNFPAVTVDLPGKADGAKLCADFVHQASADITVLQVSDLGRAGPASNTVPADYDIDIGRCETLAERDFDGHDCQFYDDCAELDVDCGAELGRATGTRFLDSARFDRVIYLAKDDETGRSARYYAENFNCTVLEIETASRKDALPFAHSLGFWYDGRVTLVPAEALEASGSVTLANGEAGVLHRFGALSLCWAGSVSSSTAQTTRFKPFMLFEDAGTCWVNWDAVPSDYTIRVGTTQFDRSGELLR